MNTQTFKVILLAMAISNFTSGCKTSKPVMTVTPEDEKMEIERAALHEEREIELKKREDQLKKVDEDFAKRNASSKEAHISKLSQYFDAITSSNSIVFADNRISEALKMFESANTPVLIVVNEEDGRKDYGKPTTIGNYLTYLKEQKKNINLISNLKIDCSGKITEVELWKN